MIPRALVLLVCLLLLIGCERDQSAQRARDVEISTRAAAAAEAEVKADSEKFRRIAEGKEKPSTVKPPPPASPPKDIVVAAPVAPSPIAPNIPPPRAETALRFDNSPDGKEAHRLMTTYIGALKDPESARFRDVKSRRFTDGRGDEVFGVCGEINAKNSYGGYIGFRGFVAYTKNREYESSTASGDEKDWMEQYLYVSFAQKLGCLPPEKK